MATPSHCENENCDYFGEFRSCFGCGPHRTAVAPERSRPETFTKDTDNVVAFLSSMADEHRLRSRTKPKVFLRYWPSFWSFLGDTIGLLALVVIAIACLLTPLVLP